VRDAEACVRAIQARGRLPLLVGGTMLYFKALFEGLDDMPPAQPALRAELEAQARGGLARAARRTGAGRPRHRAAAGAERQRSASAARWRCTAPDTAENDGRSELTAAEFSELRDRGIFATRQLAKRQLTWLRSMPQRQVVACDQPGALQRALARCEELLRAP
jgi:tRNA A37 N6-isopentenylltransferase MiaA